MIRQNVAIRNWRWSRSERGMVSTVLVLAVPALLFVALVLITIVGDAVGKRTETSTAADAAALAAAEAWRSRVGATISDVDSDSPDGILSGLRSLMTTDVWLLHSADVARSARELAGANDAEVTSLRIRPTSRGLEFAVDTRGTAAVAETSTRAQAHATAVVELTGGACWSGNRLGVRDGGRCLDWSALSKLLAPPVEEPSDDEADEEVAPPPPPAPQFSVPQFRADVRLVA